MAASTNNVTSNTRKKASNTRKPLALALLLLAAVGAMLLFPRLINPDTYRQQLATLIGNGLGGKVELGPLRWGLGADIWLQAQFINVTDATLLPVDLEAGPVYLRLALAPLLRRSLVFKQITIADPRLRVRLQAPVKSTAASTATAEPIAPLDIRIKSLRITGGRIRLQDQRSDGAILSEDIQLSGLMLKLTDLEADSEARFELALVLESAAGENWGRLQGKGRLLGLGLGFAVDHATLSFDAELSELAAEAQRALLPVQYRQDELGGSLSASIDYRGGLGDRGTIAGDIDMGRLSYGDPSLWSAPLHGDGSRLQFQFQFDPQQFQLQQLELSRGELAVTVQGILYDWSGEPVFKRGMLQAQLPLRELIPLVPWVRLGQDAAILRDLLGGGGTVQIENITLPDIALANIPEDKAELLCGVTATASWSGLSLVVAPKLPRLEQISGRLQLRDSILRGSDISAQIGPLNLPVITLLATELLGAPRFDVTAKGPITLAPGAGDKVAALLSSRGLNSLSGSADVDIVAHYDQAHPDHWSAKGGVQLQNLKLHTLNTDAELEVHGRLLLRRQHRLDLLLDGFGGLINEAPFKLEGKILDLGSDRLLVDLEVKSSGLELAPLTELVPVLAASQLKGKLDADLSIFFVGNKPKQSYLKGTLAARGLGLYLVDGNIRLEQLDSQLVLAANRIDIEQMEGRLNQQAFAIDGYLAQLPHIGGKLRLTSPEFNLDQLLPESGVGSASPATVEAAGATTNASLPEALRLAELQLDVRLERGQYRNVAFHDFGLELDYGAGLVRNHRFAVKLKQGTIHTSGQADLNDLDQLPFDIHYQVDAIRLENILHLLKVEPPHMSGPLSVSGHIMGRTGAGGELQRSLRGELSLAAGPGKIPKVGNFGKGLFTILGVINVKGLITGQLSPDLAVEGIPYDSLELQATFTEAGMRLDRYAMLTTAISAQGLGRIDLAAETMNMELAIGVLGTLDKALGMVPLVGSAAASITKAYLEVEGPIAEPRVRVRPAKGLVKALENDTLKSGSSIGRFFERLKGSLMPGS